MFQIGAGKAVGLHLGEIAVDHIGAENGTHHDADAGFSFAAAADDHQHFLRSRGRDQAVADELLQGEDVLHFQKLIEERDPDAGIANIRIVPDGQAVAADLLFLRKSAVEKERAVRYVDAVCLHRQFGKIRFGAKHADEVVGLFCKSGGHPGREFVVDRFPQYGFVADPSVHREKAVVDADHRVPFQKVFAKSDFIDFAAVVPFGKFVVVQLPFLHKGLFCENMKLSRCPDAVVKDTLRRRSARFYA